MFYSLHFLVRLLSDSFVPHSQEVLLLLLELDGWWMVGWLCVDDTTGLHDLKGFPKITNPMTLLYEKHKAECCIPLGHHCVVQGLGHPALNPVHGLIWSICSSPPAHITWFPEKPMYTGENVGHILMWCWYGQSTDLDQGIQPCCGAGWYRHNHPAPAQTLAGTGLTPRLMSGEPKTFA